MAGMPERPGACRWQALSSAVSDIVAGDPPRADDRTTRKGRWRMSEDQRLQAGVARFTELFGRPPTRDGEMDDFTRIAMRNLFGDVWTREGLTLRERSMITVTALIVLGRADELRLHLRGALNIGISRQTIEEMMIHLAHYGGYPVGRSGLHTAREVFDKIDAAKAKDKA
jgi:alkylhydroperoxidase/carboxymuconolactone decarboxylase family protein YurZ